ncbi:MAG: LacI family DNA-binding transcriptional regulator [Eubacteriales bacterium]|nr:LacI family DNA-binding transcriptional regulator [Eubacteriales bacterium]
MAATIKDIAQRTGLGLATISSYLNGGNVRDKNRVKIEAAIEELHFEVNEVARGLKTNKTHTIGVVIPELNNIFCSEVITSMEDILRNHGYATIVCDCRTDKRLEHEAVDFLSRKRVDAIINMPVDTTGRHLEDFRKSGKPIVLIDRKIKALNCDCVFVDNLTAARNAVELLVERGHQHIGVLTGPEDIFTVQERMKGYWQVLKEHKIPARKKLIYHGDYTMADSVQGMEKLIRENPKMTAVFATNYETTMGAVIGANELGIHIPDRLSLVGFDNLQFARACHPKLTIVTQPTHEIGVHVAKLVLKRLHEKNDRERQPFYDKLQTDMILGNSVLLQRH